MEYGVYKEIYQREEFFFDSFARELINKIPQDEITFSVLDVGCGFGNFLRSFRREWKASGRNPELLRLEGITIADHEIQFIREREQKTKSSDMPTISVSSIDQSKAGRTIPHQKFDLLVNFHTLSYLTQDEQIRTLQEELLPLVKSNGWLLISWIDSWIKKTSNISNQGQGYLQFFYHPKLWRLLGRVARLERSFKEPIHNYRITYWKLRDKPNEFGAWLGWIACQKILIQRFYR